MDDFELNVSSIRYDGKSVLINQAHNEYIGTQKSPIVVHIDSDTDWPAIVPAGAGVVVALLVAWLTVGVQRNQIQGNISNFRHQWIVEFRGVASELIQLMTFLINCIYFKKEYKDEGGVYFEKCAQMALLRARVELLLSRDDDASSTIRDLSTDLVRRVAHLEFDEHDEYGELLDLVAEFKNLIRAELESAWGHMKNDLGLNRRFLFFGFFKR